MLAAGGFPYVISIANTSYRLSGSLSVPAGKDGIDVSAANVTIDLNGFSISGLGASTAIGINASLGSASRTTVENGIVTGFIAINSAGIYTNGGIVRNVQANANYDGIITGSGSVISGNTANNNTEYGIYCNGSGCLISGNTLFSNNLGIGGDQTSGFGGNVLKNTTNFLGTTSLGAGNTNLCTTGVISSAC